MTDTKDQNQGIPYHLRRIQVLDAAILAGIIATFTMTYSTDQKVTKILAERAADDRVEVMNPPVRLIEYRSDRNVDLEHVRAIDGRVTVVEGKLQRK